MNVKISSPTSQALSKEEFLKFVEYAKVFNADGTQTNTPCTFSFDGAYTDEIDKFKEMFPNVDVSALIAYIRFKDSGVEEIVKTKIELDAITINDMKLLKSIDKEFYDNANITSFIELQYATDFNGLNSYSFGGCTSLKELSMPPVYNLKIGHQNSYKYFDSCLSLEKVFIKDLTSYMTTTVYNDTPHYAPSRPLANAKAKLYLYNSDTPIVDIIVPNNVSTIKPNIFYNYSSLKSVVLHSGINKINFQSFALCNELEHIDMDYVTNIVSQAFLWCTKLKLSKLPDGLTNLSESAEAGSHGSFYHCESITINSIPSGVTKLSGTFVGCYGITSINLNNVDTLSSTGYPYQRNNPSDFGYNSGGAFMDCKNLESAVGNNVVTVGAGSFMRCAKLSSVTLPNASIIYDGAFYGCTSIKTISLPSATEIKNSGTSYGYDGAFRGCTSLESVTLGANLTTVGSNAFYGCTKLNTFKFLGTMEQWSAVTLGSNWKQGCPFTKVECSDGDVTL